MESLPVLLLLSFIQAWLSFDLVLSGEENEVLSNDSVSKLLHLRVRRGWVWRKIFVEEEDPTPRTIGQLKSDLDEGDFSIQYVLSGEGAGEIFLIDEFTGDISSVKPLDREKKPFYTLQAQAISRRTHRPVEPESEFIIRVQDINDNTPEFVNEPYECSIPERSPTGTTVFQVSAHDADDPLFGSGAKLIFSILQGEPYFSVQPTTGVIVTTWSNLDREASETHLVLVQVKDQLGGAGAHSASTTVTVRLSDVNDNGPAFQRNLYWFAVSEGAAVGTVVGRIRAEDGDEGSNTEMIYNLKDPEESSTFSIHTDLSRQEGIITLRQPLDYESKRQFIIAVEAVNAYPDLRFLREDEFSDRTTVKISVTDEDEPPVFSGTPYLWKIQENVQMGTAVGKVLARDADVNCNPLRFRLSESSSLQRMFRIDPENGTVFVNSCLDRETQAWFNLTVIATETRDNRLQSAASLLISVLDVNDNQPRLAYDYQPHVCEDIGPGELVELLSATDADDPPGGHHFYFSMIPDKHINPNFTIRDNQDNTASILARRSHFSRDLYALYLLPVVIRDSGSPALSSTSTLSISVCVCQPETRSQCQSGATEKLRLLGTGTKMLIIALSLLSLSARAWC